MTPTSVLVASLVRNEADRYLRSALECWSDFADEILVLDDNSTDGSDQIAEDFKVRLHRRPKSADIMWGHETPVRKNLFELAVDTGLDWLVFLDADMIPGSDPRPMLSSRMSSIAVKLFDLWGTDSHGRLLFRHDDFWQGHTNYRIWMIRNPGPGDFTWPERGLHCGHLPSNIPLGRAAFAPTEYSLLHYGYHKLAHRVEKVDRYLRIQNVLTPIEIAHAKTISDPQPNLLPLPFEPTWLLES